MFFAAAEQRVFEILTCFCFTDRREKYHNAAGMTVGGNRVLPPTCFISTPQQGGET
jgi:hypothetical protein